MIEEEKIKNDYIAKFGIPYRILTTTLNDEIYINLMAKALKRNYALEKEEIEAEFDKVQYDFFKEEQDMTAGEYAQRYSK